MFTPCTCRSAANGFTPGFVDGYGLCPTSCTGVAPHHARGVPGTRSACSWWVWIPPSSTWACPKTTSRMRPSNALDPTTPPDPQTSLNSSNAPATANSPPGTGRRHSPRSPKSSSTTAPSPFPSAGGPRWRWPGSRTLWVLLRWRAVGVPVNVWRSATALWGPLTARVQPLLRPRRCCQRRRREWRPRSCMPSLKPLRRLRGSRFGFPADMACLRKDRWFLAEQTHLFSPRAGHFHPLTC